MKKFQALGFCGSLRKGSYNRKLLNLAGKFAEEAGVSVRITSSEEMNLPLYNGDLDNDADRPESVRKIVQFTAESDLFLMAMPEYNYSIAAPLKNAIDWISRIKPNPFDNKPAVLFGVSSGPMGTIRGQYHLRQVLTGLNVLALPQPQIYVPNADSAFEDDGSLKNKQNEEMLKLLIRKTIDLIK